MSKITNVGLTRSGTGCFKAVPVWQQWASKGLTVHQHKLYIAIHVGICWKVRTEEKSKTDITKTKHNPAKANNTKHSKTKLAWFSRFLRHLAPKRGGLILQRSRAHAGHCRL